MKIVLTGSLGHIGKPLTGTLVQKGYHVTVISSKPERQTEIETLGATAAIGTIEDVDFLTRTFTGANAVYTMLPPGNYLNSDLDLVAMCASLAGNFATAIKQSGVKRLVHLSSIGAHMEKDSGLILLHREVELALNKLTDVAVTFMRPAGFYYNLYGFIPMIKSQGFIAANYGGDDQMIWVAPADIAAAIADELETQPSGNNIRYVASDELTGNDTARILGEAIGLPGLKWIIIPSQQMQTRLEAAGMPIKIAAGLVEMYAAVHTGELEADYYLNKPAVMGKVKMADFAGEFAAVFKG
jgi:uncharacterized protein YbjT (DUF2867 family)